MFNFEVSAYLSEIKEGENFNHRCSVVNALGVNTYSISRIALKLHCVPKFKLDADIGRGRFEIGSNERNGTCQKTK
jgi:hypothetical protein